VRLLRRRELIAGGVAALGSATALAGVSAADVLGDAHGDREVLARLLAMEQAIAFSYEHVLAAGVLSATSRAIAAGFLPHEREHVRLLSGELAARGGATPPGPASSAAAEHALAALGVSGGLGSSADAVHYLIALETLAEGAYYESMARLIDRRLMRLAAEIMSAEAQHWSGLSQVLHSGDVYSAVPQPVVTGG
jgi:rubrerythrin